MIHCLVGRTKSIASIPAATIQFRTTSNLRTKYAIGRAADGEDDILDPEMVLNINNMVIDNRQDNYRPSINAWDTRGLSAGKCGQLCFWWFRVTCLPGKGGSYLPPLTTEDSC